MVVETTAVGDTIRSYLRVTEPSCNHKELEVVLLCEEFNYVRCIDCGRIEVATETMIEMMKRRLHTEAL